MPTLTIEVPSEVAARLATAATARGLSPEALAAEVLVQSFPPKRTIGFTGSARGDATEDPAGQRH